MIAILINDFRELGGQRAAINLANGLAKHVPVTFVVFRDHGVFRTRLNPDITVRHIGAECRFLNVKKIGAVETLARAVHHLHRLQPSVVISFTQSTNLVALALKRLNPAICAIVQEHAHVQSMFDDTQYSRGMRALWRFTLRQYRTADAVICCSNAIRQELIDGFALDPGLVHAIPPPVNVEELDGSAMAPCQDYQFEPGYRYILAAGRFEFQKNFSLLIRSFALVRQRNSRARLIIVGEGSQKPQLEGLITSFGIQDAVSILPFQKNLSGLMSRAHLFVLSSKYEGMPQVIAEAMICDLPVVATDCPTGPAEMLEHGISGFLVPMDDAVAMADQILAVLEDEDRLACIAAAARVKAINEYGLPSIVGCYLNLVNGLNKVAA